MTEIDRIARLAHAALLREAEATPKPGLVDRGNSGAHADMTIDTFYRAISALEPYWQTFAASGAAAPYLSPAGALRQIRPIGLDAERAMCGATNGVNTHKGAIFSLGLLCCACGRLAARGEALGAEPVCAEAAGIARETLSELATERSTKGGRAYAAYGVKGARGEAAGGFLSARTLGLPEFSRARAMGAGENDALLFALLRLINSVEDTNVLLRAGPEAARWARAEARAFLGRYSPGDPEAIPALLCLDAAFSKKNISPGGCADLLAVTWFLAALEVPDGGV